MDTKLIENGVRMILQGIGEDPDRPGLVDTPARVTRMYEEVLAYTGVSNEALAQQFGKCFIEETPYDEFVCVRNIPAFSWCEHHIALMYDMRVSVIYRPRGKVIGLSKVPRIVDAVTRRLQLQERIGHDILDVIKRATGCEDIAVIIEAKYSCVTARGIHRDAETRTVAIAGVVPNHLIETC